MPFLAGIETPGATVGSIKSKSKLICTPSVPFEAIAKAFLQISSTPYFFISSVENTVTPASNTLPHSHGSISLPPTITAFLKL